jgi:hypothetical protein
MCNSYKMRTDVYHYICWTGNCVILKDQTQCCDDAEYYRGI